MVTAIFATWIECLVQRATNWCAISIFRATVVTVPGRRISTYGIPSAVARQQWTKGPFFLRKADVSSLSTDLVRVCVRCYPNFSRAVGSTVEDRRRTPTTLVLGGDRGNQTLGEDLAAIATTRGCLRDNRSGDVTDEAMSVVVDDADDDDVVDLVYFEFDGYQKIEQEDPRPNVCDVRLMF